LTATPVGLKRSLVIRRKNFVAIRSLPAFVLPFAALAVLACDSPAPEPLPAADYKPVAVQGQAQPKPNKDVAAPKPPPAPMPVAPAAPASDDPVKGKWTLDDATQGLPKGKQLVATIETDLGKLTCKLFDDKAPIAVANFVGLARGVRPWKTPEGTWEKKPAYDGTIFHRIIKGFMIQGGDAKKNGSGEAGYIFPDEVWDGAKHDRAGLLCMANRGPNTNSAQFFITDASAPHLDKSYTIFGECGPVDLIHKIAAVEVVRDRPKEPPVIKSIKVTRK
jgi:peptidyl-prolyl cis-trans isomerase A (cyclophilin A)